MKKFFIVFLLASNMVIGYAALPPVFSNRNNAGFQKDELTRVFISPVKIVWVSDGTGKLVKHPEVLLKQGNSQSDVSRITQFCSLTATETDSASILLDYGRELHGGLQLVMGNTVQREPIRIRIRFGESIGEVNSDARNSDWVRGFSNEDHARRDIIIKVPRAGMMEIGNTGFRFVRIDLLQPNATVNLKEVRAILRYRDIPYLGSFKCSNPRLDSIWMTGAYTTHLNMQEYLWDGIKRDRLVWLGDFHPELKTINTVFGYNEVIPKSLDLACQQYPIPQWMNGMSSYSMWYLIIHYDWYMQNGNIDFLRKHRKYMVDLIDLMASKIDDEGTESLSSSRFLDWPSTPNQLGVEAGYRALLKWALTDAEKLFNIMEEKRSAAVAANAIKRLDRKAMHHHDLKQAAALMAVAGLIHPKEACEKVIAVDGAKRFSTFYGLYMLNVLSMAGMQDTALDIISDYWGGMLDMGATTFWEDFNIEWKNNSSRIDQFTPDGMNDIHRDFGDYCYKSYRHSLCHGWASGPTSWLTENVLGITIVEPGCKTLLVKPYLGNLEWAEGSFPTPFGIVYVKHRKGKKGKIETEIKAPKEIRIITSPFN